MPEENDVKMMKGVRRELSLRGEKLQSNLLQLWRHSLKEDQDGTCCRRVPNDGTTSVSDCLIPTLTSLFLEQSCASV